ncbi:MAG TPA: hypothetical protein VFD60_09790, partial [Nitrososphaeraceae archaeon]|nr:hypothetical protein [Nitrososphaeraceae archaeon]
VNIQNNAEYQYQHTQGYQSVSIRYPQSVRYPTKKMEISPWCWLHFKPSNDDIMNGLTGGRYLTVKSSASCYPYSVYILVKF